MRNFKQFFFSSDWPHVLSVLVVASVVQLVM